MRSKNGFTIVEVVLVLVVLIILGGVGYLAYTNFIAKPATTETTATDASKSTQTPVAVDKAADLDNALAQLNTIQIDDTSAATQLNDAASSF